MFDQGLLYFPNLTIHIGHFPNQLAQGILQRFCIVSMFVLGVFGYHLVAVELRGALFVFNFARRHASVFALGSSLDLGHL